MKIISFIFSIYVVVLSFIPCIDTDELGNTIQATTIQTQNHSEKEHIEICTPFCSCFCCGCQGFSIPTLYSCPITLVFFEKATHLYKSFSIDDFFDTIWQPPKIC